MIIFNSGPLELVLEYGDDTDALTISAPRGYFDGDIPVALRYIADRLERDPVRHVPRARSARLYHLPSLTMIYRHRERMSR